jgi:integrase
MANKSVFIKSYEDIDFILKIEPLNSSNKTRLVYNVFNPATGKKERKITKVGLNGKKKEKDLIIIARLLADSIIDLIKQGMNPITRSMEQVLLTKKSTILDCIINYQEHRQLKYENRAISKSRISNTKIILKHFTNWLNKNSYQYRKPDTFTLIDFQNFFDYKLRELGWNKETFNTYRSDLKSFWIYLKELRIVDDYDCISRVPHKNTRKDSTMYSIYEEEQLSLVYTLLKNDLRYSNLLLAAKLLYDLNIRLEEQLKFQIEDYDPKAKTLTLPPYKTKNGDEARFELDEETALMIESRIEEYPPAFYILGADNIPSAQRLAYGALGQRWRKFRKKYKYQLDEEGNTTDIIQLPDSLKFYALKHSSSYYAKKDGETLESRQQRLRHHLESTTKRYSDKLEIKPIKPVNNSRLK